MGGGYPHPVAENPERDPGPPPAPWAPDPAAKSLLENRCGLVDRSHRGRLILKGPDAASLLHGQLSNDIESLTPGHGCEAGLLTPKGKLLGIIRVLNTTTDEYRLDTDRVSLQALFDQLRRASVGHKAELIKGTLETSQLSLIGPTSASVVGAADLLDEHDNRSALIGGTRALIVATFSGFDVVVPSESVAGATTALLAAGAQIGDESAAECLRVEAGHPRWGIDIDDSTIPQEADLNHRLVSFTKGCYVGQETVARLFYRGSPNRTLRGLLLSGVVDPGTELTVDGRPVGTVGSVAAPIGDEVIALAMLRNSAEPGMLLNADGVEAEVAELPFTPTLEPFGAA